VVTHQLQVERRRAKAHRPKTNALPLDHATNRRRSKAKNGVKWEMVKETWKGKAAREAEEKDKGVRTIQQELTQQLRGHRGLGGGTTSTFAIVMRQLL